MAHRPPLVGLVRTPSPAPQLIQLPFSNFVIPNATGEALALSSIAAHVAFVNVSQSPSLLSLARKMDAGKQRLPFIVCLPEHAHVVVSQSPDCLHVVNNCRSEKQRVPFLFCMPEHAACG